GSFDRHTLLARRQKTLIVNFSHVGQAREAESFSNLADVASKTIAIIGADAFLTRRRGHDLMIAEPGLYPARILALRDRLQFQHVIWHAMARGAFARSGTHPPSGAEHDHGQKETLTALHGLEAETKEMVFEVSA